MTIKRCPRYLLLRPQNSIERNKESPNQWKELLKSLVGWFQTVKMSSLSKLIYTFNMIQNAIPSVLLFLMATDKLIKIHMNMQMTNLFVRRKKSWQAYIAGNQDLLQRHRGYNNAKMAGDRWRGRRDTRENPAPQCTVLKTPLQCAGTGWLSS